ALEVDDSSKSLHDEVGADVLGEIDDELREVHDPHVVEVAQRLLDHRLAILEAEQRLALLRVAHRGDDHFVEQVRGGLHHLAVAVVERVERTRVQDRGHAGTSRRTMVTTVLPYRRDLITAHGSPGSTSRSLSTTASAAGNGASSDGQASKA